MRSKLNMMKRVQAKNYYQYIQSFFLVILSTTILDARSFDFDQAVSNAANTTDYFRFYTTNNIDIRGDVAKYQGDDFNTGTLLLKSRMNEYIYGFNFTLYTQSNPDFSATQRVDVIEGSLGKSLGSYHSKNFAANVYLFGQCITAGNFGGEAVQTMIHQATKNSNISLPYSTDKHTTIGLSLKADSLYYINEYQYAFANTEASINIDGSGYVQLNIGTIRHYKWFQFKLLLGIKYISPLQQELVEAATVERVPKYAIAELGFSLSDRVLLFVGSKILGDNIYGNQSDNPNIPGKQEVDDPFTYLNVLYTF